MTMTLTIIYVGLMLTIINLSIQAEQWMIASLSALALAALIVLEGRR